jgi:hypothetical protein
MEKKMLGASLKAGLIIGLVVLALFVLLFVVGLLSIDLAIPFACFVLSLAIVLFFVAGRLAARFAGRSAPGAGALAAAVAALMAAPAVIGFIVLQVSTSPSQFDGFSTQGTVQSSEEYGISSETFSGLAAVGSTLFNCLILGPIVAAGLGSIGARVRRPEPASESGVEGALAAAQQPIDAATAQVQAQQTGEAIGEVQPQEPTGDGPEPVRPEKKAPSLLSGCFNVVMIILVVTGMFVAVWFWIDSGTPARTMGYAEEFFTDLFGGGDGGGGGYSGGGGDGGGGGSGDGEKRRCIKPIFAGKLPTCSDDDGVLRQTYLNEVYIGDCTWVDENNTCRQD